ncbi:hypothetical protein ONE63_009090 [Megalurothrips usitatus]|uniref:Intraflagellar transport protein 22 homolog n=1 Tax=Megalurothrips usitatus TaxID=439358 RepID=A0AAV7XM61_9NEOP|nr:hypothetical protein ONE63_009090 [Megalurothrips usitatus]
MKPCAVALSSSLTPASDIVKLIVSGDEFQKPMPLEDGIVAYPWHIDTKYYTADVHVCALQKKTLGSAEFANSVQAVILFFDSTKNEGLTDAEQWEAFVKEYDPDIRILLCGNCEENPSAGISKLAAQEWCIARGYELVELNPIKDEEWEEEQDFIETTGAPRILQALHAHVWPDLNMKEESSACSRNIQSILLNPSTNSNTISDLLSDGQDGDDGLSIELQNLRLREEALKTGKSFDPHILDEPTGMLRLTFILQCCVPCLNRF